MNDVETKKKDKVMYEGYVSLNNKDLDTLLIINESKLIFQKKKGLLIKKDVVIKEILLDDVKVIKNRTKIEVEKERVLIYTSSGEFKFSCEKEKDAKKVVSEIKNLLEGPAKKEKMMNFAKGAATIAGAVGAGVGTVVGGVKLASKLDKDSVKKVLNAAEKAVDIYDSFKNNKK